MRKKLLLLILYLLLLLVGCSSHELIDEDGMVPHTILWGIQNDIETRIAHIGQFDQIEFINVLNDNNNQSCVKVYVSLAMSMSEQNSKNFASDVTFILPIILAEFEGQDVQLSNITFTALEKEHEQGPNGLISWNSDDGRNGSYMDSTYGRNIYISSVSLDELTEIVEE